MFSRRNGIAIHSAMLFQVIHYLIFYLHHTHFHFFSSSRYVFILLFAHHFYLCLLAFYLSISYLLSYLICWNSLHILLLPILFIPFPIPPFTLNLLFIFFFILIFILTFYVTLRYSVLCLHSTSFSSFSFFLFTFLPLPSSLFLIFYIPEGDQESKYRLWAAAVFGYVFAAYFMQLLYAEYNNFSVRRLQYLVQVRNVM